MNYKSSQNDASIRKSTPEYIEQDLQVLENYFNHDRTKCPPVIYQLFSKHNNVYLYALDLMYYSKDFLKGKLLNSLSQFIIEYLKEWCAKHNVSHLLNLEIKSLAVQRALQQSNGNFVQFVCDVYKIKDDYAHFVFEIRHILKEKKFREVGINCSVIIIILF